MLPSLGDLVLYTSAIYGVYRFIDDIYVMDRAVNLYFDKLCNMKKYNKDACRPVPITEPANNQCNDTPYCG